MVDWRHKVFAAAVTVAYVFVGAHVFVLLERGDNPPPPALTPRVAGSDVIKHFAAKVNVSLAEVEQFAHDVIAIRTEEDAPGSLGPCPNVTSGLPGNGSHQGNPGNASRLCASPPSDRNWSLDNAVLLAITIITTIGYGHMTIATTGGKLFTVAYAILGVPLGASVFATVGSDMQMMLHKLHKTRPWIRRSNRSDEILKSAVSLGLGTAVFLLAPSGLWVLLEDWDYATALYFSTVTMTTVGFGDYVIGYGKHTSSEYRILYRVCACLWLVLSLSWLALVIAEISRIYLKHVYTPKSTDEEKDGQKHNDKKQEFKEKEKQFHENFQSTHL